MEEQTIWNVNGQEFYLDIADADTVERYEAALSTLEAEMPQQSDMRSSASIRAYCKAFRTMFDALFGAGAGAQIFGGIPDNIRRYTAIYGDFLAFVAKQAASSQAEMTQLRNRYLPKGGKA